MRFFLLRFLSLLLLWLATSTVAFADKRVLFIVETSKETKSLTDAEDKLVSALLETGLGGLLEANDTFGVWTFDDTLHVGKFPMQTWNPAARQQLAARTSNFLKQQSREKSARIESVWRPLQNVIRNSPALMTVIVATGKQPVRGTPFDDEINLHLKRHYREYQRKKTPVVIMLSSTEGNILRYSLNPAIGDIRVPVLTVPPKPPVKIAEQKPRKPSKPAPTVQPSKPALPASTNTTALVITREGAKNIPTAEADRIPLNPPSVKTNLEPEKITGPVVLKHAVEEVTHTTVAITPTSTNVIVLDQLPSEEPAPAKPKNQPESTSPPKPKTISAPTPEPAPAKPAVASVPQPIVQQTQAPVKVIPSETPTPATQPKIETAAITPAKAESTAATLPEPSPAPAPSAPQPTPEPAQPAPAPVVAEKAETNNTVQAPAETAVREEPRPDVSADTAPKPADTTVSTVPPVQPAPLIAQTETASKRSPFLLAAVALLLIAVVLAFLIGRMMGNRPRQSLVSDWAERDRMKK